MRFSCRASSGKTRILNVLPSTHSSRAGSFCCVDDLLVDGAAVIALGHAAFHEVAIDVHRQPRQRRIGRQREIERPFQPARRVVEIRLIDRGAGEAVLDVNVNVILAQREVRFLPLGSTATRAPPL